MDAGANEDLIQRFYSAFADGRGDAMAACYAPRVHFSDPVFPDLEGEEAGDMWRMLTGASEDLRIELLDHAADESTGSAHWQANYTFSRTGRPVVNDVRATFSFADGLIAEHRDDFDFHRWSRQALGPLGLFLGWTPIVRNGVRRTAAESLAKYRAEPAAR